MIKDKGIFISYSHKDMRAVEEIALALNNIPNVSIWYDASLQGGDDYFKKIAEQILQNEIFIFVVSENSVESDWCIHELQFAMSEKRKIIAIWLEDFVPPPIVRLVISNTHYILKYQMTFNKLQSKLEHAICNEEADQTNRFQNENRILSSDPIKYFLTNQQVLQIKNLLEDEKQGRYSNCFNQSACVLLGIAYELGIHTEKDKDKAQYYYNIGIFNGSLDSKFLLQMLYHDENNESADENDEEMCHLADSGSVLAMVYWGNRIYTKYNATNSEKKKAIEWWKVAAETHAVAQYYMAEELRNGTVLATNYQLALMYARMSSEQGYPQAFRTLGLMHENGEYVDKDVFRAKEYYQTAIKCGDFLSEYYLGNLECFCNKDYTEAVAHYQKAAQYVDEGKLLSGLPYLALARSHKDGRGVARNNSKTIELYLLAASKNVPQAIEELFDYVTSRDINELIFTEKIKIFKKACELNCKQAYYYLGLIYEQNNNFDDALVYWNNGLERGDMNCCASLLSYYSFALGKPEYRNKSKALNCFRTFLALYNSNEDSSYIQWFNRNRHIGDIFYYFALELDTLDMNKNGVLTIQPDHAQALYYYRKCFDTDNCYSRFGGILAVAIGLFNPNLFSEPICIERNHYAGIALMRFLFDNDNIAKYIKYSLSKGNQAITDCVSELRRYYKVCEYLTNTSVFETVLSYISIILFHEKDTPLSTKKRFTEILKYLKNNYHLDITHEDALKKWIVGKYNHNSPSTNTPSIENKIEYTTALGGIYSLNYSNLYELYSYRGNTYAIFKNIEENLTSWTILRLDKSSNSVCNYYGVSGNEFNIVWKLFKEYEIRKAEGTQ